MSDPCQSVKSCNLKDKINILFEIAVALIKNSLTTFKMSKSLQSAMGDIDPALFFIALIVALIFAIYQSWSSDGTEDEKDSLKNKRAKKAMSFEKLGSHTNEFKKPQVISVCDNKVKYVRLKHVI